MNSINTIGRTSENAQLPGLYESACCDEELLFAQDDTFCRCPHCHRLCEWELTEPAVSTMALETAEEEFEYAVGA
jgi:hypothetical protein